MIYGLKEHKIMFFWTPVQFFKGRTGNFVNFHWYSANIPKLPHHCTLRQIAMKKNKKAVWIVSNCRTPSKRQKYVMKLKNYISMDVYGDCGRLTETPVQMAKLIEAKAQYRRPYKLLTQRDGCQYCEYLNTRDKGLP